MWLNDEDKQSTITFGEVPAGSTNGAVYKNDIDASGEFGSWWTVDLGGFYYNGINLSQADGDTPVTKAIIDSGTSFMLIGPTEYEEFII